MDKLFIAMLTLLILCPGAGAAQSRIEKTVAYVPVEKFDPKRDAAADLRDAVAEAGVSGRRIILDVGGDWCIWCKRLDSLFRGNEEIAEFLHKNYVVLKINSSKENENEKFLSAYPKIEGYPHLFVLGETGKLLRSQDTGLLESGKHHDPAKVMAFLKKWAPGASTKAD